MKQFNDISFLINKIKPASIIIAYADALLGVIMDKFSSNNENCMSANQLFYHF